MNSGLKLLADRYLDARSLREELDEELKRSKQAEKDAETALLDAMATQELPSFKTNEGVSFSATRKTQYSCSAEHKAELMKTLKDENMEDLFTVNPATLNKAMKELVEENGGMLPEAFNFMKEYEEVKLTVKNRPK